MAVVAAVFAFEAPASLHASPITYTLALTGNGVNDFNGTGSFTIEGAPAATGVSTYYQSSPATIDALSFTIDGKTFTFAGASNTLIQFVNGALTDITFSEEIGANPFRFALHTTGGYAFYYNNEQSVSYGSFTSVQVAAPSPVPEPASIALFGTGLLGVAGLYRRFSTKQLS